MCVCKHFSLLKCLLKQDAGVAARVSARCLHGAAGGLFSIWKTQININSSIPHSVSLSSDSCQCAKKRSSATYCFLAGPVWATLSACRWSKWRGEAAGRTLGCVRCLVEAELSWAELFSHAGRPPGLRHHQLPELRESGGLVRHGEEGQRRVRHPARHLPDREQK